MRLAIITTHPIQYNAPWFRLLAQQPSVTLKVFYTWSQSQGGAKYDPGFGQVIQWDIPLLDGYDYTFIENVAADPGSHRFKGIDNPTLNKTVAAWQPDAVMVIGWSYKSHLACMRYFKGKVPVLFRGDSTLLDEQPGVKKIIRRLFLRYVYSFVDYALYVGTNNKNYFLAHGLKEQRLHHVPHAVDNERFRSNGVDYDKKAQDWRRQLGLSDDHFVVLFAGKLEPKKNPQAVLELAQQMPSDKLRFVLVGNGPLENDLKEKASADGRILFVGFQNQQAMPLVYRLGDVFLLPSKGPGETWGLAINEAMACGKPVIASDKCGGAADLIQPSVNGHIIQKENINEVVLWLAEMMSDAAKPAAMGKASKQRIQRYSFAAIVDQTVVLLNQLQRHA